MNSLALWDVFFNYWKVRTTVSMRTFQHGRRLSMIYNLPKNPFPFFKSFQQVSRNLPIFLMCI